MMWAKLDLLLVVLVFLVLIGGAYFGITGQWLAADINQWQMRVMGGRKYFPIFSALLLMLPPLLVILAVKLLIRGKLKGK